MCVGVCVFVYILILGWLVDLAMTVQGPGGAEITRWGPRVFISGGRDREGHRSQSPPMGLVGWVW